MKKTILAMAVFGLVATGVQAAHSEQVPVRFTGEVKAATCKVTVGQAGNHIELGRVDPDPGATGTLVPIVFNFKECKSKVTKIALHAGQNNDTASNVASGFLATNNENVIVKLFNDASANTFSQEILLKQDRTENFSTIPYYARLEVGNTKAQPGDLVSAALFVVSYE